MCNHPGEHIVLIVIILHGWVKAFSTVSKLLNQQVTVLGTCPLSPLPAPPFLTSSRPVFHSVLASRVHGALRHNNSHNSFAPYMRPMTATSTPAHSKGSRRHIVYSGPNAHTHPLPIVHCLPPPPPTPIPLSRPEHAFCIRGVKKNKQLINSVSTQTSAFWLN